VQEYIVDILFYLNGMVTALPSPAHSRASPLRSTPGPALSRAPLELLSPVYPWRCVCHEVGVPSCTAG